MGKFLGKVVISMVLSYLFLIVYYSFQTSRNVGIAPMWITITIILLVLGGFIDFVIDTDERVIDLEMKLEEIQKELQKK